MELEPEMLATETIVPVYFAMEDEELLSIYTQTLTSSSTQGSLSAAEGRLWASTPDLHYTVNPNFSTWFKHQIFFDQIKHDWWDLCSFI